METFRHTITQEDLDNNPGLEADLKVGDEIEVPIVDAPKSTEEAPETPDEPQADEAQPAE